jgi:cytochrome c-type protein NapC
MPEPTSLLSLLAMATLVLVARFLWLPEAGRQGWGRVQALVALLVLPSVVVLFAGSVHLERSTRTSFCLSCHVMEPFGDSLSGEGLAASHYQNNRVPREQACYSCHTDYTMYGGLRAKWRGLRHVWVNYLGSLPDPADIELYVPYRNRECLHCHRGARSFEEVAIHSFGDMPAALESNEVSCLGCHGAAHDVDSPQEARSADDFR